MGNSFAFSRSTGNRKEISTLFLFLWLQHGHFERAVPGAVWQVAQPLVGSPGGGLALVGYTLLRTDQNGWIELATDGEQLWVEVERK